MPEAGPERRQAPPRWGTPWIELAALLVLVTGVVVGAARNGSPAGPVTARVAGSGAGPGSALSAVGGSGGAGGPARSTQQAADRLGPRTTAAGAGAGARAATGSSTSAGGGGGRGSGPTASASVPLGPDCDRERGRLAVPPTSLMFPPRCLPLWPAGADNGGATWLGVTAEEITIALYEPQDNAQVNAAIGVEEDDESQDDEAAQINRVVAAFEAHFETYGRRVKWVKVRGSGASDDEAAARADALKVALEIKAFASIGDPSQAAGATAGGTNVYIDELAQHGVLCVACTQTQPQRNFEKWAPMAWGQRISADQLYVMVAEYVGKRLAPWPAEWAGDPLMQSQPRRFGLVQYNTPDGSYDGAAQFLAAELARYGVTLTDTVEYQLDVGRAQEISRTLIARFKDRGITSVVCYCDPLMPTFFTKEATNQQYFPEWIITGSLLVDSALFGRLYDQVQWRNAHGISLLPARVDPDALDAEPDVVDWHHGEQIDDKPYLTGLSMLFTGIHNAGPVLTPSTFRQGMAVQPPAAGFLTRIGSGFGDRWVPWTDYHAMDDTAEIWWDPEATGPDELGAQGQGLYRYVEGGRRYLPGERPQAKSRAFDPADTVTIYAQRPERDRWPAYNRRTPLRAVR